MPIRRQVLTGRVAIGAGFATAVACLVLLLVATHVAPSPFAKEIALEKAHPGKLLVATDPHTQPISSDHKHGPDGAPSGPAVTLVVGDSGAYYLGQGMDREGPAFNRTVVNRGTVGCGIARGDGRLLLATGQILHDPVGCDGYIGRWIGYLNTYHPKRVILVLADVGGGDRYLDGKWRNDCDAVWSGYFQEQAIEALAVLHASGAKVSVTTIPDIATQQPASAAQLTDCRNTNLIAAGVKTKTQVVDFRHWSCPTPTTCITRIDGIHIRPDDVHYLGAGADMASKWIFSQIPDP